MCDFLFIHVLHEKSKCLLVAVDSFRAQSFQPTVLNEHLNISCKHKTKTSCTHRAPHPINTGDLLLFIQLIYRYERIILHFLERQIKVKFPANPIYSLKYRLYTSPVYPTLCRLSSRILSAIIAMNSEFVGLPRRLWMVYPK